MATGTQDQQGGPRLVELQVAADPVGWRAAGFHVDADTVHLGGVALRLLGSSDDATGIVGWTLAGVAEITTLDGLPTTTVAADGATEPPGATPPPVSHPNSATKLDHVVVLTPDLERTIEACEAAGLDLRRIRETESYGAPMRQAFFRLGTTILEVVSGDAGTGVPAEDAPATWFGLAVDVDDLEEVATQLGEGLGSIKVAVQDGRRIATFRHKALGMGVAVAAMDDHAARAAQPEPADLGDRQGR